MVTKKEREMETSFFAPAPGLDDLARLQGVQPVAQVSDLQGNFWPEEETDEEIIATVRQWRQRGG